MSEAAEKLKSQLAALAVDDRAALAQYLIRSLDDGPDEDVEAAWDAELARRGHQIESGKATGISADEVFAELRKKHA